MKHLGVGLAALLLAACSNSEDGTTESAPSDRPAPETVVDRFAVLALDCVHREYPNKISHVMQSADDVQAPSELTPAFYGCFDWHSSVHGHWLLSRVLTTQPDSVLADEIRTKLAKSFTEENLAAELAYYEAEGRRSFERPYGIAWYLQLVLELEESDDPELTEWRDTLRPLEDAIVAQVRDWLPKLSYPIRLGTHNQTAFAFGLMLDYADGVGNQELASELREKTLAFHRGDVNCPLAYEPSGEDFLSPCLMEADLMRRVMAQNEYAAWLGEFLPQIPSDGSGDWLEPGVVLDASDGKLVHLDGVNLSRAWALEGIASALPEGDQRIGALLASAEVHRETGVAAVSDEHYSGSHWLASFATYLTTKRGIAAEQASN
ncbi:DUF2891 domain-containing protein [uncultured Erythrobacter sp.]|uniref:DUF2891 domain-containing protein n=1 Tax=uncultured Erythrobacter sp. TaxID=263913 RepID=UPI0026131318|nr:DUF2891 domain-containing protein [uncultured Erythrobacter sp.]